MLLRYSFPNFLPSQDVTKITRDLNCKYMEVPRMVTPHPFPPSSLGWPRPRILHAEKWRSREGHRGLPFLIPFSQPCLYHPRYQARASKDRKKDAFDDTCDFPSRQASPPPRYWPNSKTVGPSEGKWILARDRNRIKRNPADRNDFALRPNRGPARKSTVFSFVQPSSPFRRFTPSLGFRSIQRLIYRAKRPDTRC